MFKSLIPTILKVLDIIPLKGYRTVVFTGLAAVTLGLGSFGVLDKDTADLVVAGLLAPIGYFAAKHEE